MYKPIHIDQVMACGGIQFIFGTADTVDDFDLLNSGFDHVPVAIKCKITSSKTAAPKRRRVVKYDVAKIRDPKNVDEVNQILKKNPRVPFAVELESHLQMVNQHVETSLIATFPRDEPISKNNTISNKSLILRSATY